MRLPVESFEETSPNLFTAEISELQIEGFPREVVVSGIGNSLPFRMSKVDRDDDGDLQGVYYAQELGSLRLLIIND